MNKKGEPQYPVVKIKHKDYSVINQHEDVNYEKLTSNCKKGTKTERVFVTLEPYEINRVRANLYTK